MSPDVVLPPKASDTFHTPPSGSKRRRPRRRSLPSPAASSHSSSRSPKKSRRRLSATFSDLSLSSNGSTVTFAPESPTEPSPPSPSALECAPASEQTSPFDEVERSLAALHGAEHLPPPSRCTVSLPPADYSLPVAQVDPAPSRDPATPSFGRLSLITDLPLPPGTTPEDLLSLGLCPSPSPSDTGETLEVSPRPPVLGVASSDPPSCPGQPDPH